MTRVRANIAIDRWAAFAAGPVVSRLCVLGPDARLTPRRQVKSKVAVTGRALFGARGHPFPFACAAPDAGERGHRGESTAALIGTGSPAHRHATEHLRATDGGGRGDR